MHAILPGVYAISGLKTGRSYLLEDQEGLTLIDTSTKGRTPRIVAAIESIGRRPAELHTIVATHYHHDHTGNAAAVCDQTGARLHVHVADAPYVDGRLPWMMARGRFAALVDRLRPTPYSLKVDGELHEGDVVPALGGLSVVHLPGHTPGNIGLYSADRALVFTGDALMNVFGLRLPLASSSHDMELAKDSVRKLARLDFEAALPGHGQPVLGRAAEKIANWASRW